MLKNQYQSTETFPIPSPNGIYKGNLEKEYSWEEDWCAKPVNFSAWQECQIFITFQEEWTTKNSNYYSRLCSLEIFYYVMIESILPQRYEEKLWARTIDIFNYTKGRLNEKQNIDI